MTSSESSPVRSLSLITLTAPGLQRPGIMLLVVLCCIGIWNQYARVPLAVISERKAAPARLTHKSSTRGIFHFMKIWSENNISTITQIYTGFSQLLPEPGFSFRSGNMEDLHLSPAFLQHLVETNHSIVNAPGSLDPPQPGAPAAHQRTQSVASLPPCSY